MNTMQILSNAIKDDAHLRALMDALYKEMRTA